MENEPKADDWVDSEEPDTDVLGPGVETVQERVARLPMQWMRRYVRALFECGGIGHLARSAVGGVSALSVNKYAKQTPLFGELIKEAEDEGQSRVRAAVLKAATEGDEVDVFHQGVKCGTQRKRSTRDAELYLKMTGAIGDKEGSGRPTGAEEQLPEKLPELLAAVSNRLFLERDKLKELQARSGQLPTPE